VDETGHVLRRWVLLGEYLQLVEQGVIQLFHDLAGGVLEVVEIDSDAPVVQLLAPHRDLHLPVVPVQVLAFAPEVPQLVCR